MNRTTALLGATFFASVVSCSGCTLLQVEPPDLSTASLSVPPPNAEVDFLIETVDLIDRMHPIGRVSDWYWFGQYQVVLSKSLKDYFEAKVTSDLQAAGFRTYRYPGEFAMKRFNPPKPVVHLILELQELTLSRHPKSRLWADYVIGVCKIRGLLFDGSKRLLYQRQFVGQVDTYRPTDELVLPGVGLFSRAGLSAMLSQLLDRTIRDFRQKGMPQITIVFREFREKGGKPADKEDKDDDVESTDTGDTGADKDEDEEDISF